MGREPEDREGSPHCPQFNRYVGGRPYRHRLKLMPGHPVNPATAPVGRRLHSNSGLAAQHFSKLRKVGCATFLFIRMVSLTRWVKMKYLTLASISRFQFSCFGASKSLLPELISEAGQPLKNFNMMIRMMPYFNNMI